MCSGHVVDAALKVHSALGPGLLENAYQVCLAHELRCRGIHIRTQVPLPVHYRGIRIDLAYRLDLLVEGSLIVEVKTVGKLLRVHEAQLRSYLRLSGHEVGLLVNFHVPLLRDGLRRITVPRSR